MEKILLNEEFQEKNHDEVEWNEDTINKVEVLHLINKMKSKKVTRPQL